MIARAMVRLAAGTLPRGIRSRYREEWLGDLAAAQSQGVRPASVAVGALLFSATLDRDAPHLSGMPLPVLAVRHARRAIALLGVAAVLLFGSWINGQVSPGQSPVVGAIIDGSGALWPALTVLAGVSGLLYLWRAAIISSALARVTAALATAGIAAVGASVIAPALSGPLWLAALVLLIGAGICGLIVWSAAPATAPAVPLELPVATSRRPLRRRTILLLSIGGVIVAAVSLVIPSLMIAGIVVLAIAAAVVGAGWVTRDRVRAPRSAEPRPWWTVAGASLALFALVAIGTLDLLVWSPLAMAPGYSLDAIYAALTPADRTYGIIMALVWTGFWGIVALVYLLVGLASARRPRPGTRRSLVLIAATIAATAIFLQWWAGFSLGNSISDTLPPFSGARTEVSGLLGVIGQLCLSGAILGWVGPRSRSQASATTASSAAPY